MMFLKYRFKPAAVLHVGYVGILMIIALFLTTGQAQTAMPVIDWPEIALVPVAGITLNNPTHVTHAGDNSNRLFLVEQGGAIRIYEEGSGLRNTPFLDINGRVLAPGDNGAGNEEGLLSVAFPPGYAAKDYFYVYYTNTNSNNVLSRFHLLNENQADPGSEEPILVFNHPGQNNHNGGQISFGPDGYLYIGTGDGGGGGDPNNNAQNGNILLGKILRIDTEPDPLPNLLNPSYQYLPLIQQPGPLRPTTYDIPVNNPFINVAGFRPEIWALGLRNPWRFSHDRQSGALFIGDVGQGNWEEIDYQPPNGGGENYGWRIMEGQHCYNSPSCNQVGLTLPIAEYANPPAPGACASVTGGYVYRGTAYPVLQGIYLYTDACMGKIWGLAQEGNSWLNHEFDEVQTWITSFGENQAGELFAVERNAGVLYRITAVP